MRGTTPAPTSPASTKAWIIKLERMETPPGEPLNLRARSRNAGVKVRWDRPQHAKGLVSYVLFRSEDPETPITAWATVQTDKTHAFIENVAPGQELYFLVQAKNERGYGPFSPQISHTQQAGGDRASGPPQNDQQRVFRKPHPRPSVLPFLERLSGATQPPQPTPETLRRVEWLPPPERPPTGLPTYRHPQQHLLRPRAMRLPQGQHIPLPAGRAQPGPQQDASMVQMKRLKPVGQPEVGMRKMQIAEPLGRTVEVPVTVEENEALLQRAQLVQLKEAGIVDSAEVSDSFQPCEEMAKEESVEMAAMQSEPARLTPQRRASCVRHTPNAQIRGLEEMELGEGAAGLRDAVACVSACIDRHPVCAAAVLEEASDGQRRCRLFAGQDGWAEKWWPVEGGPTRELLEVLGWDCDEGARWEPWADWPDCSAACGGGRSERRRDCVTTGTLFGARQSCAGAAAQSRACNEIPCDEWNSWGEWGPCSVSCGTGSSERWRTCPAGMACFGPPTQLRQCRLDECPKWSEWSEWGQCSASCATGIRKRSRDCYAGVCLGPGTDAAECDAGPCPSWSGWGSWSACSVSCGQGLKSRSRLAISASFGRGRADEEGCGFRACRHGDDCAANGPGTESRACDTGPCPRWDQWAQWTPCSRSCGPGSRKRRRECVVGMLSTSLGACGGAGDGMELGGCEVAPCPAWSGWSSWTACSKTCGVGVRKREKHCSGALCERSERSEEENCDAGPCPLWGVWSSWSQCSESCGRGARSRSRSCRDGVASDCPGSGAQKEECKVMECPGWASWGSWGECSASCGGGDRRRKRECQRNDDSCIGARSEVGTCSRAACPVWSGWSEWGACSSSCAKGTRIKTRDCVKGSCLGSGTAQEPCDSGPCPTWSDWGSWRECSVSCGAGYRMRDRECRHGVVCAGLATVTEPCKAGPCPHWSHWSEWAACSASCGLGSRTRARKCKSGDKDSPMRCLGAGEETVECNDFPCPHWTPWTTWSQCTATCGPGSRTRVRDCYGGNCNGLGASADYDSCDSGPCPLWSAWSPWTECSVTCARGSRQRSRLCQHGHCSGSANQTLACDTKVSCLGWSPWAPWNGCSVTCGEGVRQRDRECMSQQPEEDCVGKDHDFKVCALTPCPNWEDWTDWGPCTASCGKGQRTRARRCKAPGLLCSGPKTETRSCTGEAMGCPYWTSWSRWSECSATCARGNRLRTRECRGGECLGLSAETKSCRHAPCPKTKAASEWPRWSHWTDWSHCSASCGAGTKMRERTCEGGTGEECHGPFTATAACNQGPCPQGSSPRGSPLGSLRGLSQWSEWSECSASCGSGVAKRSRQCQSADDCLGALTEEKACQGGRCEGSAESSAGSWSRWGEWSGCHGDCGQGVRVRRRECVGGGGCHGLHRHYDPCPLDQCKRKRKKKIIRT